MTSTTITKTRGIETAWYSRALLLIGISLLVALLSLQTYAHDRPDTFADLVEKLQPAVVNISTLQLIEHTQGPRRIPERPDGTPFDEFFDEFFGDRNQENGDAPPRRAVSLGSGYIIDASGIVITNNHVIRDADEITVTLDNGDQFDAEIIGRDAAQDIAVLQIEADQELVALEFGNSDELRVGDWVLAIGNPFGLGGSVTAGIVSGLQRNLNAGNFDYFIQTDASINRGNSGGPMFNLDGQVVGMNTLIFSPTGGNVGVGFAIPSNDIASIVAQIREFGRARRGYIGVTINQVTEDIADSLGLAEARGAIIGNVVEGGPSEVAGLEPGDVIIRVNGQRVDTSAELPRIVSNVGVGEEVDVTVFRNGEEREFTIITVERPEPEQLASATPAVPERPRVRSDQVLGMRLSPATAALRERYEIPEEIDGIVIVALARSSDAFGRLLPGDVIVEVNKQPVSDPSGMTDQIAVALEKDRSAVLLRVYRASTGSYVHIGLGLGGPG